MSNERDYFQDLYDSFTLNEFMQNSLESSLMHSFLVNNQDCFKSSNRLLSVIHQYDSISEKKTPRYWEFRFDNLLNWFYENSETGIPFLFSRTASTRGDFFKQVVLDYEEKLALSAFSS
jgi:hypothetical protein